MKLRYAVHVAKDIADKDGSVVKTGIDKAAAEEMKKKLTEAGATVEIK
ncbi:MAG: ribosomal protein L7/L12 [Spirochaetes bacterium]|nr:ribosomal protein L7/L12 [Spirochaetota bacterium]